MNSSQNYGPSAGKATSVNVLGTEAGQTVQTPWSTANRSLLRQYLDQVFYPTIFPADVAPTEQEPHSFTNCTVDLSDLIDSGSLITNLNREAEDENGFVTYTPVQRLLMLHRQFVVFLGHRQSEWWDLFIAELIHFFGECGETELIVQVTLRESIVMQTLRPFC